MKTLFKLKAYLKITFTFTLMCIIQLHLSAQSIISFSQGASSDYYYNFNFECDMSGNFGCDCLGDDLYEIIESTPGAPGITVASGSRAHSTAQWVGTDQIAVGHQKANDYTFYLGNDARIDNFFSPCFDPCGAQFISQGPVSFTTDPIYPPANVVATNNPDGSVTVTWDVVTDIPENLYGIFLSGGGILQWIQFDKSLTEITIPCVDPDAQFNFNLRTDLYNTNGNAIATSQLISVPISGQAPRGSITGTIHTKSCVDVTGGTVKATLLNPTELTNYTCWPTTFTTQTNTLGEFTLEVYTGIDGDLAAMYEVEAVTPDHQFRKETANCEYAEMDSTFNFNLTFNASNRSMINFIDITSYAISGQVLLDGSSCGLQGVTIQDSTLNNSFPPVITDVDGNYSIVIPEGNKTYYLKANTLLGNIADSVMIVNVIEDDINGVNFTYTKKDTLKGFVGAGCTEFIGQASLEVRNSNQCVIKTIQTDVNGYYEIEVPSGEIHLEVTGINLSPNSGLMDEGVVVSGFGGPDTLIVDSTITNNFTYRRPIKTEIANLPSPHCGAIAIPILKQKTPYVARLKFTEGLHCLIDTGYVVISDNISGLLTTGPVEDTVYIQNGYAYYTILPGDPNFAGDYSKTTTFTAYIGEEVVTSTYKGIVTGTRQRGSEFITSAPTIMPFLILRDPYGDQSYSQWSTNNTLTISHSHSLLLGGGIEAYLKAGPAFSFFGIEGETTIGASFGVNGSKTTSEEEVYEISTTQIFKTSDDSNVIGEKGDVYAGASYNFIYAIADELKLDAQECRIYNDTTLLLNPDSFATTYVYTDGHIRNTLIPQLELVVSQTSDPAIKRQKENDIFSWKQILQLNEKLKKRALRNSSNYSFDGALGTFGVSVEETNSGTESFESQVVIDASVAAELKLKAPGIVIEGGVTVNFKTEIGRASSTTTSTTTTTEYWVDDANVGDVFTMDIGVDPVFATPVFKLRAGRSSCPWEAPTAKRDLMTAEATNAIQVLPAGINQAFYDVNFFNFSETGEGRSFKLELDQLSTGGAEVFRGSNNFTDPITLALGVGLTEQDNFLKVVRPNGLNQYDFEGIQFYLYPACYNSYTTASEVYTFNISAFFDSPCSNIDMSAPLDNWEINGDDNNELLVTMSGYDLDIDFENITLQYSPIDSVAWTTSAVSKTKAELLVGSTTSAWDIPSSIPDGNYVIRFRLQCGVGANVLYSYSNRTTGSINRNYPLVFGSPRPLSDLSADDPDLSVIFNEDVIHPQVGDYYLMSVPDSTFYPASIVLDGNEIRVVPGNDISLLFNVNFEVGLINVEDLYGNERPDTVKWQFLVQEPDSDFDGIPDTKDRCHGGNDLADSDLGGLPDDCDCVPFGDFNDKIILTQENNIGLDFDGINDQIEIPHNPIFNFDGKYTFETWIKTKMGSPMNALFSSWEGIYPGPNFNYQIDITEVAGELKLRVLPNNTNVIISNNNIPENIWTHVAVVMDSNQVHIYFNGILDKTANSIINDSLVDLPIRIGAARQDAIDPLNGQIEEVRIWNTARTEDQINTYMDRELYGSEGNLVTYFNFNEGTPGGSNLGITALNDLSIYNNDALLYNFDQNGFVSNWVTDSLPLVVISENDSLALCKSCPITIDTVNVAMDFTDLGSIQKPRIEIPLDLTMVPSTSNQVTIEAWIKNIDDPNYRAIVSSEIYTSTGDNFLVGITGTNLVLEFLNISYYQDPRTIPINTWTHIAVTFNGNSAEILVNGESEGPISISMGTNYDANIVIGDVSTEDLPYEGQIDDLRFWDHIRTPAQIQENMHFERTGSEEGLIAYYNFNYGLPEGNNLSRDTIHDFTGNGHIGTLVNFERSGISSNWVSSPFQFSDEDGDGTSDFCDNCFSPNILTLENKMIDGIYYANDEIILGDGLTIPSNADIKFRAPKVKVIEPLTVSGFAPTIRIQNVGCPE